MSVENTKIFTVNWANGSIDEERIKGRADEEGRERLNQLIGSPFLRNSESKRSDGWSLPFFPILLCIIVIIIVRFIQGVFFRGGFFAERVRRRPVHWSEDPVALSSFLFSEGELGRKE